MTAQDAAQRLLGMDQVLILTHRRPDGDTIGCASALCLALQQKGKTAWVLPNEDAHHLFDPYLEGVLAPAGFVPQAVVAVDVAALGMLPDSAKGYREAIDLVIDHHGSQEYYGKETCVDPACAACGELLFRIFQSMGVTLTQEIALRLYVAIATDSGCFAYSNTTAYTHTVAAALLETGIDYKTVNKIFFRTKSRKRMQLEAAILNGCEFYDQGRVAVLSVPLSLMEQVGASETDAEDLSALGPQIEGVDCAVTMRELEPDVWKMSLRTGPRINATDACSLLGGGGHAAAAGCTVKAPLAQAKEQILRAIAQVAPDYQN